MQAKATAKTVRISALKSRLVMRLINGKNVGEAYAILANTNKASSPIVAKVIKSAVANATNNFNMNEETLFVKTAYVDDGIRMKRYMPRAKGSASGLVKRTCHITVVVAERM